jgi:hypothetical protein
MVERDGLPRQENAALKILSDLGWTEDALRELDKNRRDPRS